MKAADLLIAGAILVIGCSQDRGTATGSSPNTDTGSAVQNIVVNAQPDGQKASPTASASANGNVPLQGAGVNETNVDPTNGLAKPQHPPAR